MNANQDYGIALHILGYLAFNEENYVTSSKLASSINTNPVVVRRMLSILSKAGFIETKRGHYGSRLLKKPSDITFYDVYHLFNQGLILGPKHDPNIKCEVGLIIINTVTNLLEDASNIFETELKSFTILDIKNKIENKIER